MDAAGRRLLLLPMGFMCTDDVAASTPVEEKLSPLADPDKLLPSSLESLRIWNCDGLLEVHIRPAGCTQRAAISQVPRVAVTRIIMHHRSLSTGRPHSAGLQKPGILAQWARTTRILMSSSAYN